MSKRGFSWLEVFVVIAVVGVLTAIVVPSIVHYKKAECEDVAVGCGDVPGGYKLQRNGNQWRVASTEFDWHSSLSYGSRSEAVNFAKKLAGVDWKDEDCEWVDDPTTKSAASKEYKYEIYSNGKCYFWYDKGCGISVRRFSSCAGAICGVEAYFRMLSKGDADGTKRVLTDGMNWPYDTQYRGYNKVKSGVFKCEPEAKPSDDCGCD